MEKLERVLVAEDGAREALADARAESARIRAAALEEARRIEEDATRSCDSTIAAERAATLAEAQAEADRITRGFLERRDAMTSSASARLEGAARRVATTLGA